MGRKRKNGVPWSDLPIGPLELISKSLDTETDVRRFRAVCKSWRSSATSFKKSPFANLKLPFFDDEFSFGTQRGAYYRLTERTVFRVQSPKPNNPNSWLLKLETADDGKFRLVNPLNELKIKITPKSKFPKVLNTLNFRVSEVCRAYTLHYVNPSMNPSNPYYYDENPYSKKVAVYADPDSKSNDYIVMAIGHRNKLWYIKSGDEKWTMMDREFEWANSFHDVMCYKGQFHLVDACGAAWVLNSNFERTNAYVTRSSRVASNRRLVEMYDGELYLVEGVTDKDKRACKCDLDDGCECRFSGTPVLKTVVEVVVSRMDKSKRKWVETKAVKDRVIFMGEDCSFALPSKEFERGNGGRVFYTDVYTFFRIKKKKNAYGYDDYHECSEPGCCSSDEEDAIGRRDDYVPSDDVRTMFRGWHGHNVCVCDLKSRKIGSLLKFPAFAGVFWPLPWWLE